MVVDVSLQSQPLWLVLCPPEEAPHSLTEEFSRISCGEGRPQDRAQHHVQLEFLPLGDELGAVHLGEERGMWSHVHACSLSASPGTPEEAAAGSSAWGMKQRGVCLPPQHVARSWPGTGKVPVP